MFIFLDVHLSTSNHEIFKIYRTAIPPQVPAMKIKKSTNYRYDLSHKEKNNLTCFHVTVIVQALLNPFTNQTSIFT